MSKIYPTSQWTQVRQIQSAKPDERAALIGRFIELYLPAIRADIKRQMNHEQSHDVDDAVHEFLTDKLYEGFVIDQADSKKGRLTRYIQSCVHHFVHTKKTRPVKEIRPEMVGDAFRELDDTLPSSHSPSENFEFEWVAQTLKNAINQTKTELIQKNKNAVWHVLEARLLCEGPAIEPFKVIANRLGLTQKEAANLLITGKRALKRHIYAAFNELIPDSEDIEADVFEACDHIFRQRLSFGVDG